MQVLLFIAHHWHDILVVILLIVSIILVLQNGRPGSMADI